MSESNSVLFVIRQGPYGNKAGRDAIEAVLAFATFEQPVSLYFSGDGVWQLLSNQASDKIAIKPLDKLLNVLPLYDIEQVFACQKSVTDRAIKPEQFNVAVELIDFSGFQALADQARHILSF